MIPGLAEQNGGQTTKLTPLGRHGEYVKLYTVKPRTVVEIPGGNCIIIKMMLLNLPNFGPIQSLSE